MPKHPIAPRPFHSLFALSISCFGAHSQLLTVLSQEQPIALFQSDPMSCKAALVSFRVFPIATRKRVGLLEYLSSGLNLAGCADFVTSPAWTCNEAKVSAGEKSAIGQEAANLVEGV